MNGYENAQDIFDHLSAPFPAEYIDWRVGSTNADKTKGMALAYVDARTVADRLDGVCGMDGWQNKYSAGVNGSIVCDLGIRVPSGDWVWKADGAGASDVEGEKGALSDAFKRAAVRFGIARYLYDLKAPWVTLEAKGRSHIIPEAEIKKLNNLHDDFAKSAQWGIRSGIQAYRLLRKVVLASVTQPSDVEEFRKSNAGEIALLPVGMRKHLDETLGRIGSQQLEAAE